MRQENLVLIFFNHSFHAIFSEKSQFISNIPLVSIEISLTFQRHGGQRIISDSPVRPLDTKIDQVRISLEDRSNAMEKNGS